MTPNTGPRHPKRSRGRLGLFNHVRARGGKPFCGRLVRPGTVGCRDADCFASITWKVARPRSPGMRDRRYAHHTSSANKNCQANGLKYAPSRLAHPSQNDWRAPSADRRAPTSARLRILHPVRRGGRTGGSQVSTRPLRRTGEQQQHQAAQRDGSGHQIGHRIAAGRRIDLTDEQRASRNAGGRQELA